MHTFLNDFPNNTMELGIFRIMLCLLLWKLKIKYFHCFDQSHRAGSWNWNLRFFSPHSFTSSSLSPLPQMISAGLVLHIIALI